MNKVTTNIIINTSFNAVHNWPGCNVSGVEYLKYRHRHTFTVKVKISVTHDDRDVEFIKFKQEMDAWFSEVYDKKEIGERSCEMLCQEIMDKWPKIIYVEVLEDGENGAEKIKEV